MGGLRPPSLRCPPPRLAVGRGTPGPPVRGPSVLASRPLGPGPPGPKARGRRRGAAGGGAGRPAPRRPPGGRGPTGRADGPRRRRAGGGLGRSNGDHAAPFCPRWETPLYGPGARASIPLGASAPGSRARTGGSVGDTFCARRRPAPDGAGRGPVAGVPGGRPAPTAPPLRGCRAPGHGPRPRRRASPAPLRVGGRGGREDAAASGEGRGATRGYHGDGPRRRPRGGTAVAGPSPRGKGPAPGTPPPRRGVQRRVPGTLALDLPAGQMAGEMDRLRRRAASRGERRKVGWNLPPRHHEVARPARASRSPSRPADRHAHAGHGSPRAAAPRLPVREGWGGPAPGGTAGRGLERPVPGTGGAQGSLRHPGPGPVPGPDPPVLAVPSERSGWTRGAARSPG